MGRPLPSSMTSGSVGDLIGATLVIVLIVCSWRSCSEPPYRDPGLQRDLSATVYVPAVHHLSPEACRTMFPPDEVGSVCDYYDGFDLPDDCRDGYHLERMDRSEAYAAPAVARKVCHLNSARGERGTGLDCERTR